MTADVGSKVWVSQSGPFSAQVQRVGAAKQVQQKVADMHASALKEDPTVFDYDGVYDDIKRAREEPARRDRIARESKYVGALMAKAQERKMEESIRCAHPRLCWSNSQLAMRQGRQDAREGGFPSADTSAACARSRRRRRTSSGTRRGLLRPRIGASWRRSRSGSR